MPIDTLGSPSRGLPDPTLPLAPTEEYGPIHARFEVQSGETPDAVALSSAHGVCTFRELEQISRALASLLRARGVQPGQTVALYADRNPALVFGLLAVLRSGAAFQILDAAYPTARLVQCVGQTRPDFLLIAGDVPFPDELAHALALAERQVLRLPAQQEAARALLESELGNLDVPLPSWPYQAEQTAYLSFTSGSTGVPKGIVTTHAPLPHFVRWHVAHGALLASDRFSMLSGLSHDPLLRDIFTPLSIGASLHIPTQQQLFDADALFAWFAEQRISVAHLTPAFGEILLAGAGEGRALPHLRRLYWGGDVLTRRLVRALSQIASAAEQTNFYGATETPQAMAFFDLSRLGAELALDTPIPLGRGIDGAQLLLCDERGALCRVGELGEIWIRSPYLSRGYLDQAATEARFVPNPFAQDRNDRCYRTGDRGRYLEHGDVEFAGRDDQQLKLRGFRIEPAEIIRVLEQTPAVRRALVRVLEHRGDKQLVAYVAHGDAPAPSSASLRETLAKQLPGYMVPRFFVTLPAFPLLPNGKPDLLALPAPQAEVAVAQPGTGRAPRNEAERTLAALWAELLGLEQVDIDQSFLELGGDSLSAIRALSRMRRLGISENVARGIFQGRTIAQLAGTEPVDPAVEAGPPKSRAPLVGATKTMLWINVLRGFLVLTLVLDHWRDGIFKRFPQIPQAIVHSIEPLFDIPTPGFAFVFGIGLAYSQYENYLRNPAASTRMLRSGAWILTLGTLLMGLSRNLGVVARGLPLDYDLFCTNFFLPTLYYSIALASAPLWFRLLALREGKPYGSLLASLLLAVLCRLLYEACRLVLLPHEQIGLLQLGRLMLTARFSYFNLSTGALLGVFVGLYLRRVRTRDSLVAWLIGAGALTASLGFALYFAERDTFPDSLRSADLPLPKWLVYVGATLLLGSFFEACLLWSRRLPLRPALEWLGVVGQCAMPIFILQGMALDVSAFGRALGLPDKAATAVATLGFLLVVGTIMRRIHGLYYGALSQGAEPLRSSRSTLPA